MFLEHLYFSIYFIFINVLLFSYWLWTCSSTSHIGIPKNNIDFSFIIVLLFSYWLWTSCSTPHIGLHKNKIIINKEKKNIKSYKMKTIKLIEH